jgi:hypothetical protein
MAGAYVMVLGMDIATTSVSDLRDCGRLVTFFESVDLRGMAPRDELAWDGTQYVLACPGERYIAYAGEATGTLGLVQVPAGTYSFRWFDCATGNTANQDSVKVQQGNPTWPVPSGLGPEVAVYVSRVSD